MLLKSKEHSQNDEKTFAGPQLQRKRRLLYYELSIIHNTSDCAPKKEVVPMSKIEFLVN